MLHAVGEPEKIIKEMIRVTKKGWCCGIGSNFARSVLVFYYYSGIYCFGMFVLILYSDIFFLLLT